MKIVKEISPRNFDYWSGAADRAANLTDDDWDVIEPLIEEMADTSEEGWAETTLNDFVWFDFDTIAQWLGYKNEADFDRKRDPDYKSEDEIREEFCIWAANKWPELNDELVIADYADNYINDDECDLDEIKSDFETWVNSWDERKRKIVNDVIGMNPEISEKDVIDYLDDNWDPKDTEESDDPDVVDDIITYVHEMV